MFWPSSNIGTLTTEIHFYFQNWATLSLDYRFLNRQHRILRNVQDEPYVSHQWQLYQIDHTSFIRKTSCFSCMPTRAWPLLFNCNFAEFVTSWAISSQSNWISLQKIWLMNIFVQSEVASSWNKKFERTHQKPNYFKEQSSSPSFLLA